jgi:peroxiredoxin
LGVPSTAATVPAWLKGVLLSYRYTKTPFEVYLPKTYTRPNHSVLTVAANVGGAAFIVWCVLKVITYPLIWSTNLISSDSLFISRACGLKQCLTKRKRINRELNMFSFLKM